VIDGEGDDEGDGEGGGGEGDDEGDGEGGGGEGERDGERARVSFSEEDVLPNDADGGEETNKE